MSDLEQLYQEVIVEHHKRPRNSGRLAEPTHSAEGHNPLCGDRVTITLRLGEGRVLAACCDAVGCAICRAAGSMLTEAISGRSLGDVSTLIDRFTAMVTGATPTGEAVPRQPGARDAGGASPVGAEWGPLGALIHVRHFPGRVRCATLSWEALRRALDPPDASR